MTESVPPDLEERVLLLAPTARDAATCQELLAAVGIRCSVCGDVGQVCRELARGAGAAILPAEAILNDREERLSAALRRQPAWSDYPLIALTPAGPDTPEMVRALRAVGNMTFVKRPVHVAALISTVQAALRDRKRQYEVRRLLAERERQAEALQEEDRRKDEFLAMLAHELRNPLAPIELTLETLRRRQIGGREAEGAYATIARQVTHLTRLVDDLLDISRITRGLIQLHREPVDLATVVGHAVEMAAAVVESRGHDLMVSLPARPIRLEADPTRLIQVLFNLLHNAAKYTERGGKIWLIVEPVSQASRGCEPREVVLRVRDTGVGIPAELLPRVFDLFTQGDRTLDRAQGGLGLGLTLVKRLVEMHGGTVEAHSAGPGQGSEFVVRLPLPKDEGSRTKEEPDKTPLVHPSSCIPHPSRRVLVVDDNADIAESLAGLLQDLGHTVRTAHAGPQALEVAREFRPELILLDIGLPGMDGYEVARRLRADPELSGLLVVALSGYGQEEDRRRAREAGFDEHLTKPVGLAALQPLLDRGRRDGGQ
jgi:signal transduction histidine kinase/CheY-like chemotaxis protein